MQVSTTSTAKAMIKDEADLLEVLEYNYVKWL